jgi:glycylpeptide N-tetradecanoyltransferase
LEEVAYFLLPRPGVINSFVVEDEKTITDFMSFYSLPSSILKNPDHSTLNAAYSYYNVTTTDRMPELMKDTLIRARDLGYDVFNCLDVMDNKPCLEPLKFGCGDGHLQYYLYNWRTKHLEPKEVAIVLV